MSDVAAQILVFGVVLVTAAIIAVVLVALGRRHGFWSVAVPLLNLPAVGIAILYLPLTAPVIVTIFLVSVVASRSRRAHRWLPWLAGFGFGVGTTFLAGSHLRAVADGRDDWNVEGTLIVALLLVGAFSITVGVVEWGHWCARRVVWRGRYRETIQPTPDSVP